VAPAPLPQFSRAWWYGSWVGAVGGLVLAGAGAYVLKYVDGKGIDCDGEPRVCYGIRDTAFEGWTMTGVGAVAAVAGTVLIIAHWNDDKTTAVGLGPSGIILRGRF
jgi:hypothetical protein